MLQHVSVFHSFLFLNSIPLYGCPTFYFCICQLKHICIVSTFWYYENAAMNNHV